MKNYSYEIALIVLLAICSMAFFFLPGCVGGDGDTNNEYIIGVSDNYKSDIVIQIDNTTSGNANSVEMQRETYKDVMGAI